MILFGLTDTGLVRKDNQDSYALRVLDDGLSIAVVCDGMGGASAGNVASAIAVEAFASTLEASCKQGLPTDRELRLELLRHACSTANSRVYELAQEEPEYQGMGTTLIAAMLLHHELYIVNVGDSRCYILSGGALLQISQDHSFVQALVNRGEITKEEARVHPKKNLITRALGVDSIVNSDTYCVEYNTGDKLLLCSDGLSNVVPDDVLQAELAQDATPDTISRKLLSLAIEEGAPDNITIVLAQL